MVGPGTDSLEDTTPERRTDNIFRQLDKNADNRLSLSEFLYGAKRDRALMSFLQGRAG